MSDYIPSELIPNILARLPVADVLRCTSVCKSWYDLITSSSFISLHLKLSTPNQKSRLLVKYNDDNVSKDYFKVHRENKKFDVELECSICPPAGVFWMIGFINGLLCLSSYLFCNRIVLWNPSLRKLLKLPKSGLLQSSDAFGFGFLPETNDYKIVRLLLCDRYNDFVRVEVYELSTNSWHIVSFVEVSYFPLKFTPAVFLKGSLHWSVGIRCNDDDGGKFGKLIASFDLKNEKVGALSIPDCLDNDKSFIDISSFKESLCLIHSTNTHYDIWVMTEYGVPDSWTMQLKILSEHHGLTSLLYFRENGKVIFEKTPKGLTRLTKSGRIIADISSRHLVSYDPKSNKVTGIGEWEQSYRFHVTTYMESLVLIKSRNQVF